MLAGEIFTQQAELDKDINANANGICIKNNIPNSP